MLALSGVEFAQEIAKTQQGFQRVQHHLPQVAVWNCGDVWLRGRIICQRRTKPIEVAFVVYTHPGELGHRPSHVSFVMYHALIFRGVVKVVVTPLSMFIINGVKLVADVAERRHQLRLLVHAAGNHQAFKQRDIIPRPRKPLIVLMV